MNLCLLLKRAHWKGCELGKFLGLLVFFFAAVAESDLVFPGDGESANSLNFLASKGDWARDILKKKASSETDRNL